MPPKRGRVNAAAEERILEAAIQREAVAAVKARWPGILIQASMNGAHLAGGGRAWNMLALGGVRRDEADLHYIERGRNGEAGLYVEMKVPGKWPTTKQAYRGACVERRGNVYAVAHSSEELLKIVEDYLPVDFRHSLLISSYYRLPNPLRPLNSFSQMGSHRSEPIGKLCRSAFSLILARSFWTGRDVSSA